LNCLAIEAVIEVLDQEKDFYEEEDPDKESEEEVEDDGKKILEENKVEGESGIFDEDFVGQQEESVSDFNIADTMLSVASPVHSWQGQNLEEVIEREQIEKNWGDEKELVGGEIYSANSSSDEGPYGVNSQDFYGKSEFRGPYEEKSGSDIYNNVKQDDNGKMYDPGMLKARAHEEMMDNRRKDKLINRVTDFGEKRKRDFQDFRVDVKYDAKNG